ncbi:MbnP family protein [Sphingobacterium corticibacterium]|uniref:Copper-binding protein MbnP-like domain-containing protein n=1 Tax=Sphingobacterium corticibacterium TaxID=2484746 RepID=A0A4Q6XH89_9SPHI|nr:MbnP family protein [Sphingobacterium corticibacterium]RZF59271.1 hypothetical protein EWE74_08760 [Sphingobacterium corticibacterium]
MIKKSFLSIALLAIMASCSKDTELVEIAGGNLSVEFDNVMGNQDFALDKPFDVNGKTYTFDSFRYWVSNIRLQKQNGEWIEIPNSYYLIEETKDIAIQDGAYTYPARKREQIDLNNLPLDTYTAIEFGIGVDSELNDNLSMTAGELSAMTGMTNISWMWHTSYIFSSLKGMAEDGTTKVVKIETGLNDNYRKVKIDLKSPINLGETTPSKIELKSDVLTLLQSFDSWEVPVVGAQQQDQMKAIADNFSAKFFTLK